MYCDRCGSENRDLAAFCSTCGSPLNTDGAPSAPEQSAIQKQEAQADYFERFRATVDDRYSVLEELGRGGMAIVFLAEDRWLDRKVALKLLPEEYQHDDGFRERFLREAKIAAKLSHPNIIQIHDVTSTSDFTYFAMSYIEGISLARIIKKNAPLSPRFIAWIGMQICFALKNAHENGVIHRDIKPENILIDRRRRPVVLDFGIAKARTDSKLSMTGIVIGTPQYMSPEQIRTGEVDARSDIYSLGCVLYEMAVGHPPFQGSDPTAVMYNHVNEAPVHPDVLNETLSPELSRVIMKALAKKPANRFPSAASLGKALHKVFNSVKAVGTTQMTSKPSPEKRRSSVPPAGASSTVSTSPGSKAQHPGKTPPGGTEHTAVQRGPVGDSEKEIKSDTLVLNISPSDRDAGAADGTQPTESHRLPRLDLVGTTIAAVLTLFLLTYQLSDWTAGFFGRGSDSRETTSPTATEYREPPQIIPPEDRSPQQALLAPPTSAPVSTEPAPQVRPEVDIPSDPSLIRWMDLPGGTYLMGNPRGDLDGQMIAQPAHRVTVEPFNLSRNEITVEQYALFIESTGHPAPDRWDEQSEYPGRPVVFVSWYDASAFARWAGARLPTEAEWEFASRGGLEGNRYPWGDTSPEGRANFGHEWESGDGWIASLTAPGNYPPNRFGLYDMAGNVWEWCSDRFAPYGSSATITPAVSAMIENSRVLRGGGWNSTDRQIRNAIRGGLDPALKDANIGFRIARNAGPE